MTEHELEPLSAELCALLASERQRPGLTPAAKGRVLGRVHAALAAAGGGGGDALPGDPALAAPAVATSAGKAVAALVAAFVAGGVAGASLHAAWTGPSSADSEGQSAHTAQPPREPTSEAPPIAPGSLPLEDPAPPAGSDRAPAHIRAPAAAAASGTPKDGDLAAERSLLTTARTALSRNKPEAALAALRQHAQRFPNGRMREERESLWVQALALSGRASEAEQRAADFKQQFPKSLLGPAVEATVDEAKQRHDH
jgi:hypothetical protein